MIKSMLAGQTALITGGARRIGRAIAGALASRGVNIILHYNTSGNEAVDLRKELESFNVNVTIHRADLSNPGEAEGLISEAGGKDIDILINNASSFGNDDIYSLTYDDLIRHITINAYAPLAISRAFALERKEGSIINILDTRITLYDARHASYHLSKRMLFTATRMMAIEFAPGFRVNGIAPGIVLPPEGRDDAYIEKIAENYPLKRTATMDDISDAVLFILRSRAMTGQILYLDGGSHLQGCAYGM